MLLIIRVVNILSNITMLTKNYNNIHDDNLTIGCKRIGLIL